MEKKTTEKQKVSVKKQQWKPGNMLYPLPAVLVSLGREGEKPNLITVAWTGTVCTNPPRFTSPCGRSAIPTVF